MACGGSYYDLQMADIARRFGIGCPILYWLFDHMSATAEELNHFPDVSPLTMRGVHVVCRQ